MMRVTEGRIKTIEKLQKLIKKRVGGANAAQFPEGFQWRWTRWHLIADEKSTVNYSKDRFPEDANTPEEDKRIDFLCVRESNDLIVVEIKRPKCKASVKQLTQIEEYVIFMREHVSILTGKCHQGCNCNHWLVMRWTLRRCGAE